MLFFWKILDAKINNFFYIQRYNGSIITNFYGNNCNYWFETVIIFYYFYFYRKFCVITKNISIRIKLLKLFLYLSFGSIHIIFSLIKCSHCFCHKWNYWDCLTSIQLTLRSYLSNRPCSYPFLSWFSLNVRHPWVSGLDIYSMAQDKIETCLYNQYFLKQDGCFRLRERNIRN